MLRNIVEGIGTGIKKLWDSTFEDINGDTWQWGKVVCCGAGFLIFIVMLRIISNNESFFLGLVVGMVIWANLDDMKGWFEFEEDKPKT